MKPQRPLMAIPASASSLLRKIGLIAQAQGMPAYAVGGCVRDWLLGSAKTPDLDVTVEGDGLIIARRAAQALGAILTEHQQFGTATLDISSSRLKRIDVASCRKETYSKPADYPKVAPGKLEDDLFRRDFTVNAMAVSISPGSFGQLVDPFNGEADLSKACLRVLHGRSFIDDPSRILRGVRFLKRFDWHWDAHTRALALQAIASGALGRLNVGRLAKELEHMCDEPDPKACFNGLADLLSDAMKMKEA